MTERSPALQSFLDNMRKDLEKTMSAEDINALDVGSSHPYECKCDVCKRWWELMGPEQ